MAVIFSRGKPYRKAIYTNKTFSFSVALMIAIGIYITMYPAAWIVSILQLVLPPVYDWRGMILGLAAINFLVCLIIETFVVEFLIEKKLKKKFYRPEKSRKR